MSQPSQHGGSIDDLRAAIAQLEADLDLAREAAATAEIEQGRLRGELLKVTDLWSAACHAREQWDILLSENVEDLRLANEKAEVAERRRFEIEQSTTWKTVQLALAPYRRLRGIR